MTATISPSTSVLSTLPRERYHRALFAQVAPNGKTWRLSQTHAPSLQPGQIRIKTTHVALNPYDWQSIAFKFGIGPEARVMGRDGAGVVVDVGPGVSRFRAGDRVWFCADTSQTGTGAFQEYSVHSVAHVGHTPDNVSDEEAATLGTGLITAGVALFATLGMPLDGLEQASSPEKDSWILIWGGAGITGVYLIQLAHRLGYKVICAASPSNHDYVRSLGAAVVLDRWAAPATLVQQIRQTTRDRVRIAIDNVGKQTASLCAEVLQGSTAWRLRKGEDILDSAGTGRLLPLAGADDISDPIDAVRPVETLRISFSTTFYAHRDLSCTLLDHCTRLLANRQLLPARIQYVEGGLGGIENGLDDLRRGKVKGGYKLVAKLSDTRATIHS